MIELTTRIGRPVFGPDGAQLGVLDDVVVRVRDARPHATGILVAHRGHSLVYPWSRVRSFTAESIGVSEARGEPLDLALDTLLLARDVLDTQVIDVNDRALERVGDVELELEDGRLIVTGVELGLRPVLRRLKLGRLARAVAMDRVDWQDLHLASARGHRVALRCPAAAVHRLSPSALREVAARLPPHRAEELLGETAAPPAAIAAQRGRFRRVLHARRHAPA